MIILKKVIRKKVELKAPYNLSHTSLRTYDTIILLLEKGDLTGYGEATSLRVYSEETPESIYEILEKIKIPSEIFENIQNFKLFIIKNAEFKKNEFARSALECAYFDLLAKEKKIDFSELIATLLDEEIKTNRKDIQLIGNIGLVSKEETLEKIKKYADEGFKVIKIKIGKKVNEDIEKIKSVSEVFPTVKLRLDANEGYSIEDALIFCRFIKQNQINIEYLEQPIQRNNLDELARIRKETQVPILLDEDIYNKKNLLKAIEKNALDGFKSKLFKSGIFETIELAKIAKDNNIDFVWGNGVETQIGAFAELKLAQVIKQINPFCECIGPMKLKENITDKEFKIENGKVKATKEIGLGFELA
ncbi:hypothetical protein KY338_00815 [Candidatus Woesearchaeota archaeon]|nr:hypothetical protein [Candidatus Woesearchaeota archaeon]